jgi:hypothetical protein
MRLQGYGAIIAGDYIRDTVGPEAFCVGEYWTDMDWRDTGLAYDQACLHFRSSACRPLHSEPISLVARCQSSVDA